MRLLPLLFAGIAVLGAGPARAAGPPDLVRLLRAHLEANLDATIASAARALGIAPRTLQRAVATGGTTFRALQLEARITAACTLLGQTDLKVEAIARDVGFSSLSGFVRAFRRHRATTPTAYRADATHRS